MYFTIRKSGGTDEPPSPTPCVVPEKIRANGTTLLRIIFFPRRRQSVMRYWMYSSFIQAWNLNNTSVHVSLRVIKCSFQNYGIPGHVIWILNKKNNNNLQRLATQTVPKWALLERIFNSHRYQVKKYVIDRFIYLHWLKCVLMKATCEREIFKPF